MPSEPQIEQGGQHTPTPWYFHELPDGWCISTARTKRAAGSHNAICGAENDYDPIWNTAPNEANARFIVAAVNHHQALVDALRELAECARNACDAARHPVLTEALAEADTLLSQIGEA